MQENKKELTEFMIKKNLEAKGEEVFQEKEVEEKLADAPKSVHQEAGKEDIRAAKALAKLRIILNFLVFLPILIATILLIGYILMKFLPSALIFVRKFLKILFFGA